MINSNNYIYTNKGILSVIELYTIYQSKLTDNTIVLPKVMTYNLDNFNYEFTDISNMNKTDIEENYVHIYEVKITDVFSNRTVTLNCTGDTQLLQYNVIATDTYPIANKFIGVNKYLEGNKNRSKINIGWKSIGDLRNYANQMPCISLGDTVTKYVSRLYKKQEIGYSILNSNGDSIPIFCCMNNSTFYNFILIK